MSHGSLGVVIPAYNAGATIIDAVQSAFSAGASEVIVVDDGSTDDTFVKAQGTDAKVLQQVNGGAAKARIAGAKLISSEFLVFLDADDRLIPKGVANSVAALEEDNDLVVSAGTVIGTGAKGLTRAFPIRYSPVDTRALLTNGYGPWPPCAAVIRTEAYRRSQYIVPKPLQPAFAEDYEMLIRLSMVGSISVREEPTCYYALAGGKSERSAALAIEAKEDLRSYYSQATGIEVSLLETSGVLMAADIRRARAAFASRNWIKTLRLLLRWFSRDPIKALSKLYSRPWKRN